jgi:antitoxin PrlF
MALLKTSENRMVAASSLTSKGQATIPLVVRQKLGLKAGDTVVFEESASGDVLIRKGARLDVEFLSALESTLTEWDSESDDRAYRDL